MGLLLVFFDLLLLGACLVRTQMRDGAMVEELNFGVAVALWAFKYARTRGLDLDVLDVQVLEQLFELIFALEILLILAVVRRSLDCGFLCLS